MFARGRSATTAKTRFGGLQAFFKWLRDEGEIARSPMERMRPPAVPDQPVDVLDDDAVRRLLAMCSGRDFAAVRDTAIIPALASWWTSTIGHTSSLTGRYVLRSDWLRHAERVTADAQLHGTEASIQETYYPTLTCFGCGHANERGLRLRSYEVDGVVRAAFMPWPEHDSGGGFLNGGIVSTLLDCHGAAAVLLEAHRRGWEPTPGALLPFVTAGLDVRFLRPSPLREPVELTAELLSVSEPEITVVSRLWWEGKERATGTAVWKRWRQR